MGSARPLAPRSTASSASPTARSRCPRRRGPCGRPVRSPDLRAYDRVTMQGRLLRPRGIVTFAVLVVCAEVAGRALTRHVDRWLHVTPLARTDTSYYPFLLVGVKAAGAILLAALAARALRAWATADAGRRILNASVLVHVKLPRLRPGLSAKVWAASFSATSFVFNDPATTESAVAGRWPLL